MSTFPSKLKRTIKKAPDKPSKPVLLWHLRPAGSGVRCETVSSFSAQNRHIYQPRQPKSQTSVNISLTERIE